MNDNSTLATERLLVPAGLDDTQLQKTFDALLCHDIDSADVYFQSARFESWILEDGIVKEGVHTIERGVGVRAISGEKSGFAYSDEIDAPALTSAARAARAIARSGSEGHVKAWEKRKGHALYLPTDPIGSLDEKDCIALLNAVDAHARQQDPRVKQVIVSLAGEFETMLVAASDGTFAGDIRPLIRMNVSVIAEQDGRREQAWLRTGGSARSAGQSRCRRRTGRQHDGCARSWVARGVTTRGHRPWIGG